jgi:hypothetical protein
MTALRASCQKVSFREQNLIPTSWAEALLPAYKRFLREQKRCYCAATKVNTRPNDGSDEDDSWIGGGDERIWRRWRMALRTFLRLCRNTQRKAFGFPGVVVFYSSEALPQKVAEAEPQQTLGKLDR